MELNNYERELKYLLNPNSDLTFKEIKNAFSKASYALIETRDKKSKKFTMMIHITQSSSAETCLEEVHISMQMEHFHILCIKRM